MRNKFKSLYRPFQLLAALTAVVAITGCASNPAGSLDTQALGGAIAIDDVRRVRALVEANTITVNDVAPGIGYAARR